MNSAMNPLKWVVKYVEMGVAIARSKPLKACASMTLGLCFHFLGYECARAASITLLAAKVNSCRYEMSVTPSDFTVDFFT